MQMFRKETPSEDTRSRSIHKRANILAILALWCLLVAAFVINVLAGLGPKSEIDRTNSIHNNAIAN